MRHHSIRYVAVVAALALGGCDLLPSLFGRPTGPAPSQVDDRSATPAPVSTAAPDVETALPPTPPPAGALKAAALGFLVSNNAAGLSGKVTGPQDLVSNNAAGLVSNNAAGLVSNNAAGYRVQADIGVKDGFVYLTSPDERFWVNDENKLVGTVTDNDGAFSLPKAPGAPDLIVNVMLTDNRRLTALANTSQTASVSVSVNLATTLATEFLRAKAAEFEFPIKAVFGSTAAAASWAKIVSLTGTFLEKAGMLGKFSPKDLAVNNIPILRQRYAVLLGSGDDQSLSDEWVTLIREVKKPTTLPDWVVRPLAITTIDTADSQNRPGIPTGDRVMAVAVAPQEAPNKGNLYVMHVSDNQARLTEFPADNGTPRRLLDIASVPDWQGPGTLVALKSGEIVIMDSGYEWIAAVDPTKAITTPYFDPGSYDIWTNPRLLADVFTAAGDGNDGPFTSIDDVTFDDDEKPSMYFVDLNRGTIRAKGMALETDATPSDEVSLLAGKLDGVFEGTTVPEDVGEVAFNQPSKLTFHRYGDKRYLYVTDNGDHIIVRIDLDYGKVKQVVGELPPPSGGGTARKALCYGAVPAEKGLYGVKALDAHLRFPHKVVFDKANRMLLADSDNQLIRLATVYDETPLIWTIAGVPPQTNSLCEAVGLPPPFSFLDGEARRVSVSEVNGMTLDLDGNLILSDVRENRVRKIWTSFIKN